MVANDQQRRFSLDDRGYIVDKANLANSGRYKSHGCPNASDKDIRRYILAIRLDRLVRKLIVGSPARTVADRGSLVLMLRFAIEASQLNTLDPSFAIDRPFKGKLRRKERMRDYTSISLFVRDVERLLRELYGDLDSDALDELLFAITVIVEEFTRYVCLDLCTEYSNADAYDYGLGIGVPEGYSVSTDHHQQAWIAEKALAIRAMQVSTNPDAYCRYTNRFVKALDKYWPSLGGWDRSRKDSRSNLDKEKVYFDD
jgi:hypothetical protein